MKKVEVVQKVVGYALDALTVAIRCPYCNEIHVHGREVPGGIDLGHRVSHCLNNNNPGYEIVEVVEVLEMPELVH